MQRAPAPSAGDIQEEAVALLRGDPKRLPSHALYDALGSALFDAICQLPWYSITRAELALLDVHRADILAAAGSPPDVVELGPGSGDKLAALLRDPPAGPIDLLEHGHRAVHLVDISPSALAIAAARLRMLPHILVSSHVAMYEDGLREAVGHRRDDTPMLMCLLGSNIGNFDPAEAHRLLRDVRSAVRAGDTLLIGADLVKPEDVLMRAYDDPLGVTAAFNLNLLVRLNRDLDADFVLDAFAHAARWNAAQQRMEMHLVSRRRQRVHLRRAGTEIGLDEGESIWTESSYKYELEPFAQDLGRAGFAPVARWIDQQARFVLMLAEAR